jgi:hypothetical protein
MTEESYQRERAAKRRTEESQVRKNRLRRAFQELREAGVPPDEAARRIAELAAEGDH